MKTPITLTARFRILLTLAILTTPCLSQPAPDVSGPGAAVFTRKGVPEALGLTHEQTLKIGILVKETRTLWRKAIEANDRARANQLRNASKDKAIALLTPEQKTKYESLRENKTPPTAAQPAVTFPVLPMSAVERLGPGQRPQGNRAGWALWVTQTTPHRVASKGYVILTDHTSPQWLTALNKLVRHHHATLLRTSDLSLPASDPGAAAGLIAKLKKLQPRFVAIAPRLENYRENTLLAMIKVLSALDDDPQIDTLPGYLIAQTPQAFEQFIERAIAYHPVAAKAVQPFTVNQISDEKTNMYRSFQKSQMMRLLFETKDYDVPILTVTSRGTIARRPDYPGQDGELNWHIVTEDSKQLYDKFPAEARQHLNDTNLLLMFGHGTPGRVCGMSTGAFASIDMSNQIVLCGSCYSASGLYSDRKQKRLTPDKVVYNPQQERFGLRAISQGATLMFGHMNLNNGFPSVYPMLESIASGHCAGQAYQELLNGILARQQFKSGHYAEGETAGKGATDRVLNNLLYVMIGDPALVAFEPMGMKEMTLQTE